MENNHTPGPWKVHHHSHVRGELWLSVLYGAWDVTHNKDVGEIANCKYSAMSNEENLANAHLIAAAPDLLSACENSLQLLDPWDWPALFMQLKKAVAKAKGEQSE